MRHDRFLKLLRVYARMARRKSKSYAGAVITLYELEVGRVREAMGQTDAAEAEIASVKGMVDREYGKADRTLTIPGGVSFVDPPSGI